MSALIIHTAHMRYGGPGRLDITRGNARFSPLGQHFAPSPEALRPALAARAKARRLGDPSIFLRAWEVYRVKYLAEMEASRDEHPEAWATLLELGDVTLCCFCEPGEHCHRLLLAGFLVQQYGVLYAGERPERARSAPSPLQLSLVGHGR